MEIAARYQHADPKARPALNAETGDRQGAHRSRPNGIWRNQTVSPIPSQIPGAAAMPLYVQASSQDRAETMPFFQHERPRPRHGLRPNFSTEPESWR
jgi:hypothetical protein